MPEAELAWPLGSSVVGAGTLGGRVHLVPGATRRTRRPPERPAHQGRRSTSMAPTKRAEPVGAEAERAPTADFPAWGGPWRARRGAAAEIGFRCLVCLLEEAAGRETTETAAGRRAALDGCSAHRASSPSADSSRSWATSARSGITAMRPRHCTPGSSVALLPLRPPRRSNRRVGLRAGLRSRSHRQGLRKQRRRR